MITYVDGDLFQSPAKVLVNAVNTVGVMGKGIALQFKKRYPEMFREYRDLCDSKELDIGHLHLYQASEKWILNFPTKKHWRRPSELEFIELGLQSFVKHAEKMDFENVAFPLLGCGNGDLKWHQVKPLMEKYLKRISVQCFVYKYQKESIQAEHKCPDQTEAFLHTAPKYLSFQAVLEDLLTCSKGYLQRDQRFFDQKNEEAEYLVVKQGGQEYKIFVEDLYNIWMLLRSQSYLRKEVLSNHVPSIAFPLFEQLPYVVSKTVTTSQGKSLALRLVPATSHSFGSELQQIVNF